MRYNYTIIDTGGSSNLKLLSFLENHGHFNCVANAEDPDKGLNDILKYRPNIVFIYLDKDPSTLFSMINRLYQFINELPLCIGISKTQDQAYNALKNGFFDYWLQPFNELDIRKCLFKLKKDALVEQHSQSICLQSYKDFNFLKTDDILYLKADNNTTDFFMKDGTITNTYKTLKTYENSLPSSFIRIHQSYIVNTQFVSRINFGKAFCEIERIKKQLPFSKTYRANLEQLKQRLSKLTFNTTTRQNPLTN